MLALTNNVDELLEEWEHLKHRQYPNPSNKDQVMAFICWKMVIDDHARDLRTSRLENNKDKEFKCTKNFIDAYTEFSKDYVFKVLTDDRQT
jgi:hypothetical protein